MSTAEASAHTCKSCNETFPRRADLRSHRKEAHAPTADLTNPFGLALVEETTSPAASTAAPKVTTDVAGSLRAGDTLQWLGELREVADVVTGAGGAVRVLFGVSHSLEFPQSSTPVRKLERV